jgi:ketosteroid isomerase-like protein
MKKYIDEIFEEYGASLLAGDAARWSALATDDHIKMPPNAPAVYGKSGLQALMDGLLESISFIEFDVDVEEVQAAGDWAYARGTYTDLIEMKESGDRISEDGKFLTIFKKQFDGSWKIHRDIFNSNVP